MEENVDVYVYVYVYVHVHVYVYVYVYVYDKKVEMFDTPAASAYISSFIL